MESEEITEVIRKRPQASVRVNSKVHGNPLNQSIIYKQCGGFSLKDKKMQNLITLPEVKGEHQNRLDASPWLLIRPGFDLPPLN